MYAIIQYFIIIQYFYNFGGTYCWDNGKVASSQNVDALAVLPT